MNIDISENTFNIFLALVGLIVIFSIVNFLFTGHLVGQDIVFCREEGYDTASNKLLLGGTCIDIENNEIIKCRGFRATWFQFYWTTMEHTWSCG